MLDESGKLVLGGHFDLAAVLAHLRGNVVEPQLAVNLLLCFSGDLLVVLQCEQSVFIQCVSHFKRALAKSYVVDLDPVKYCMAAPKESGGKVRTSTCIPLRNLKLTLFSPFARTSVMPGTEIISVNQCSALLLVRHSSAGNKQVEVADGFASAAQGTGRRDLVDARQIPQDAP